MTPLYRFTLDGNKRIDDPIGWEDLTLNMERDMEFHSLVEMIDTPLEFYGSDGQVDGGYQYLKEARANGVNTQVEFLAEVSFDNGLSYDTLWNGLLDMTTLKEIEHNKKFQCGILRDDLWAKFQNRRSTKIDVSSATDLDGNARSVTSPRTITLTAQAIQQLYTATHADDITYAFTGVQYGIIDWKTETIKEIKQKYNYPRILNSTLPSEMFAMDWDGDYTFAVDIYLSTGVGSIDQGNDWVSADISVNFQINDDAPIAFTRSNDGTTVNVDRRTHFSYSDTHTLNKGDLIRIYIANAAGAETIVWLDFYTSQITVTGDTTFADTSGQCLSTYEVASAICDRITGRASSFASTYFQNANYINMLGLHVRGYSFTEKPLSMSFDEWWEGVNPIFNLGLGYDGTQIRVEEKSYFYDNNPSSAILEGVNNLTIDTETDFLLTSFEHGYQKWSIKSDTGLDDPQTKHSYATIIKTAGSKDTKDKQNLSGMYAAGLGIEETRRSQLEANNDAELDDTVIIIQVESIAASPVEPMLYGAPYTVAGLLNAETRYNLEITPTQNVKRWSIFYNIGLFGFYDYVGTYHKFTGGEGNTDMVFTDLVPTVTAENQDILVEDSSLFKSILISFTHNLSWLQYKEIRNYRTRAISVKYVANDGVEYTAVCFIKKLAYRINEAEGDFQVWLKSIS